MTGDFEVQIIRSRRRTRTITAELKGQTLLIHAPAAASDAELQPHIEAMLEKLRRRFERANRRSDAELVELAQELNHKYFKDQLRWGSIRYVDNQQKRYGSCTPATGAIRISRRVAALPHWVLAYVVMHELAHLLESNHGPKFWTLVERYPLAERARGYLMALGLEETEA